MFLIVRRLSIVFEVMQSYNATMKKHNKSTGNTEVKYQKKPIEKKKIYKDPLKIILLILFLGLIGLLIILVSWVKGKEELAKDKK